MNCSFVCSFWWSRNTMTIVELLSLKNPLIFRHTVLDSNVALFPLDHLMMNRWGEHKIQINTNKLTNLQLLTELENKGLDTWYKSWEDFLYQENKEITKEDLPHEIKYMRIYLFFKFSTFNSFKKDSKIFDCLIILFSEVIQSN